MSEEENGNIIDIVTYPRREKSSLDKTGQRLRDTILRRSGVIEAFPSQDALERKALLDVLGGEFLPSEITNQEREPNQSLLEFELEQFEAACEGENTVNPGLRDI